MDPVGKGVGLNGICDKLTPRKGMLGDRIRKLKVERVKVKGLIIATRL